MTLRPPRDRAVSPPATWSGPMLALPTGAPGLHSGRSAHHEEVFLDAATLAQAFAASPTAMIVTDDRLQILAANPAYERLTGLGPSDWAGARPCVEELPHDAAGGPAPVAARGSLAPREVLVRDADGRRRSVWMSWAGMGAPHGAARLHVATLSELGPRDGEFELWRHRARHDALTGLPNRDHLQDELERGLARAARHGHRLAVLFIDLDGFKPINDHHGHAAGDRLLARVGLRLRGALRAEDFVARHGGDEFVVVIEAPHDTADAASAAQAVLAALDREPAAPGDSGPSITASIGIALYPDHAGDAAGLLQVADEAMYRAKRAGGRSFAIATGAGTSQPLPREAASRVG